MDQDRNPIVEELNRLNKARQIAVGIALVLLLLRHRAEACLLLGLVTGLLDFALPDRLDASLLLALALVLLALALLLAHHAGFFGLAGSALCPSTAGDTAVRQVTVNMGTRRRNSCIHGPSCTTAA